MTNTDTLRVKNLVFLSLALLSILTWPALAGDHDVTLTNTVFTPDDITVNLGDTVVWTNTEGFHNVSADDASFRSGDPANPPWVFEFTFNTPGDFGYFCEIHGSTSGGMRGNVTVVDPVFSDGFESGDTSAWSATAP